MHVFIINFRKNSLSCIRKKNLYFFVEYYKILSIKDLTSKSNICFNLIFLIKELILRFADMWTYEIFEIYNIYLIQVLSVCNLYIVCIEKNVKQILFVSSKVMNIVTWQLYRHKGRSRNLRSRSPHLWEGIISLLRLFCSFGIALLVLRI